MQYVHTIGKEAAGRCGEFCIASIYSTPRNPGNHGKQLRRVVDNCSKHRAEAEGQTDE